MLDIDPRRVSIIMTSTAVATVIQMMDSLPEPLQDKLVDHLRTNIEDIRDEMEWKDVFQRTLPQLIAAARRARQEMLAGNATPLDETQL
jgi:hypothetical protein